MQIQHLGYKLKGFYRWGGYAIKHGMNDEQTTAAEYRLGMLDFWHEQRLQAPGEAIGMDTSHRHLDTLRADPHRYQ